MPLSLLHARTNNIKPAPYPGRESGPIRGARGPREITGDWRGSKWRDTLDGRKRVSRYPGPGRSHEFCVNNNGC